MHVATYADGRSVDYDSSAQQFSISDAAIAPGQVGAYDQAGQLTWISPETRDWFYRTFLGGSVYGAPPVSRRSKPGLVILAVVAVLVLCGLCSVFFVLGSAGDSSSQDGTADTIPSQDGGSEVPSEPALPHVGQPASTKDLEVTITAVAVRDSVGSEYFSSTPAEGGEYVTVQWKYKNISSEPIGMFSQPILTLVDSNGVEYSADIGASGSLATELDLTEKLVSDLNPGITVTDAAVFEVAKGAFVPGQWVLRIDTDDDLTFATD